MPNDFIVESVTEVGPTIFAVISHHEQPVRDATWTAPQEYFSQIRIPSIFWASWAVNSLLLDAIPSSTLLVGTFAKISPLTLKPLGGQSGDGEGDTLLLFFGAFFYNFLFNNWRTCFFSGWLCTRFYAWSRARFHSYFWRRRWALARSTGLRYDQGKGHRNCNGAFNHEPI